MFRNPFRFRICFYIASQRMKAATKKKQFPLKQVEKLLMTPVWCRRTVPFHSSLSEKNKVQNTIWVARWQPQFGHAVGTSEIYSTVCLSTFYSFLKKGQRSTWLEAVALEDESPAPETAHCLCINVTLTNTALKACLLTEYLVLSWQPAFISLSVSFCYLLTPYLTTSSWHKMMKRVNKNKTPLQVLPIYLQQAPAPHIQWVPPILAMAQRLRRRQRGHLLSSPYTW